MIRRCGSQHFERIYTIINEGARAYKGIIPNDCWTEPYMSAEKLQHEIDEGVIFWGYEDNGTLSGVMGIQHVRDVTLVRHAYVLTTEAREARHRRPLAVPFARTGKRSGPDRHLGRRHLGHPLLRKTWISNGKCPRKRPASPEILDNPRASDRNVGRPRRCDVAKTQPQILRRAVNKSPTAASRRISYAARRFPLNSRKRDSTTCFTASTAVG